MTYKQIEASREIRMWIVQIIVPAVTLAVTAATIPEVRNVISSKAEHVWRSVKSRTMK